MERGKVFNAREADHKRDMVAAAEKHAAQLVEKETAHAAAMAEMEARLKDMEAAHAERVRTLEDAHREVAAKAATRLKSMTDLLATHDRLLARVTSADRALTQTLAALRGIDSAVPAAPDAVA